MKKAILLLAAFIGFAANASAQNALADKPAANDTLFMIVYYDSTDHDTIYITDNDITSHENWTYHLTPEKFMQLDKIHVMMGRQGVGFFGKTPSGTWTDIRVQYTWDSFLPTGVRMLWMHPFETKDRYPCDKIVVHDNSGTGVFVIVNDEEPSNNNENEGDW